MVHSQLYHQVIPHDQTLLHCASRMHRYSAIFHTTLEAGTLHFFTDRASQFEVAHEIDVYDVTIIG